jgi:thiaminase
MRAADLLESVRADLAPVEQAIRSHPFVGSLAAGSVPEERLRAIAGEQRRIIASDRRSFAQLAVRFPSPPAGAWFLSMAQGEGEALALLDGYAAWLSIDEDWFANYEPDPRAQAYPAFVAWLALNGSVGAVTLAFLANLAAWGENCGRVAAALRHAYDAGDDAVAFFEFFAAPPPGFREDTLAVVQAGLDADEDSSEMRCAARLLQAYELLFWDALADEP